jgi:hypothetical protein
LWLVDVHGKWKHFCSYLSLLRPLWFSTFNSSIWRKVNSNYVHKNWVHIGCLNSSSTRMAFAFVLYVSADRYPNVIASLTYYSTFYISGRMLTKIKEVNSSKRMELVNFIM